MTLYVAAHDIYGGQTYFTVDERRLPSWARQSSQNTMSYLRGIAAKKLHVTPQNVRIGEYARSPVTQYGPCGRMPKGEWKSFTVDG